MMGGDGESNVGKVCTPQGTPDPNATYKYGANDTCVMTCKTGYKKEDGACVEKTSGTGPSSQKEVFYIKGSKDSPYTLSKDAAKAACVAAGATLATSAQLTSDHTAGADWCATGWLNDKDPSYPITTSLQPGCATTPQVVTWKPPSDLAGATCYGVKPTKDANPLVLPFNEEKWSKYDTYSGPKKEVFYVKGSDEGSPYTLSKEAAQAACVAAGGRLASMHQLTGSHTAGADWCASGWLNDKDPSYPITTSLKSGCSTTAKVVTWKPPGDLAGATCYGVKPAKDANPRVLPFNASKWSRYA